MYDHIFWVDSLLFGIQSIFFYRFSTFWYTIQDFPFKLHLLQDYDTSSTLQLETSNEKLPYFRGFDKYQGNTMALVHYRGAENTSENQEFLQPSNEDLPNFRDLTDIKGGTGTLIKKSRRHK